MHYFTQNFHLINISPLFIITLSFIIGIICHTFLVPLSFIFATLICCILFFQQHTFLKQLTLYSFFVCAGAWLHNKELRDYDNFYTLFENKKITITGTVIDKNEVISQYKKLTAITVTIDTVATHTSLYELRRASKSMLFYTKNPTSLPAHPDPSASSGVNALPARRSLGGGWVEGRRAGNTNISVGDTVTFYDILCKRPANESFQRYQMKEQIVATIFDDNPKYTIDHHPTWSLRNWIWQQKKRLLDTLATKFSPDTFRFFSSLFLGNRACVKNSLEETNEQFKVWGISHFLARSGLHLALFLLIWHTIFSFIPIPLICKQLIITFLSCIYFILTWTSAPFTRSFALFAIGKLCLFTKTSFHLLHYVTLVCLCFLLYSPLYLFFLDFQLSFALTFALAWFNQLSTQYEPK